MVFSDSQSGMQVVADPKSNIFMQGWRGDENEDVDIESSDESSQDALVCQKTLLELASTDNGCQASCKDRTGKISESLSAESPKTTATFAYVLERQEQVERDSWASAALIQRIPYDLTNKISTVGTKGQGETLRCELIVEEFDKLASVPLRNSLGKEAALSRVESSSPRVPEQSSRELKEKRDIDGRRLDAREFRNAFYAKLSESKKFVNDSSLQVNLEYDKAVGSSSNKCILQGSVCQSLQCQTISASRGKLPTECSIVRTQPCEYQDDHLLQADKSGSGGRQPTAGGNEEIRLSEDPSDCTSQSDQCHSTVDIKGGGKDGQEKKEGYTVFFRKRKHQAEPNWQREKNKEKFHDKEQLRQGKMVRILENSEANSIIGGTIPAASGTPSDIANTGGSFGHTQQSQNDNRQKDYVPGPAFGKSPTARMDSNMIEVAKYNGSISENRVKESENLLSKAVEEVPLNQDNEDSANCEKRKEDKHRNVGFFSRESQEFPAVDSVAQMHSHEVHTESSKNQEKVSRKRKLEEGCKNGSEVETGKHSKYLGEHPDTDGEHGNHLISQQDKYYKDDRHTNLQHNKLVGHGKSTMTHKGMKRARGKRKHDSFVKGDETGDEGSSYAESGAGSAPDKNIDDIGEKDQDGSTREDYSEKNDGEAVNKEVDQECDGDDLNVGVTRKKMKQYEVLETLCNDESGLEEGEVHISHYVERRDLNCKLNQCIDYEQHQRLQNVEDEKDLSYDERSDNGEDVDSHECYSTTDYHNSHCEKCGQGGDLICCDGEGCKITYHLSCLDPPLTEVPPNNWYCPSCACKRVSSGVCTVSRNIEAIWDVKEVENKGLCVGQETNEANGQLRSLAVDNELVQDKGISKVAPVQTGVLKDSAVAESSGQKSCIESGQELTSNLLELNRSKDRQTGQGASVMLFDHVSRGNQIYKHPEHIAVRLYFVKYKGTAHAHNNWIPENQLMKEAPKLLANFKKRFEQGKALKWNPEWVEPSRIIGKKLIMPPKQPCLGIEDDSEYVPDIHLNWFVKWKGMGYEHCTWESADMDALCSRSAMDLMKEYEDRSEQARLRAQTRKENNAQKLRACDFLKLAEQPCWIKEIHLQSHHLDALNQMRKYWQNCINGILLDETGQERSIMTIAFLLSLFNEFKVVKPVLMVVPQVRIKHWEFHFSQWASSLNTVIYSGSKEAREVIQKYELYNEDGYSMAQIVLTNFDVVNMDFECMKGLEWEALVVDECQRLKSAKTIRSLQQLASDYCLLLFSEPMKNNADDSFLSLLQIDNEAIETGTVQHHCSKETEAFTDLKARVEKYIIYGYKNESVPTTYLKEFWVPVEMTAVQVEEYCKLLIDKYDALVSRSKSINAASLLQELLLKLRECCNHPYLVNPDIQVSLPTELTAKMLLDLGIKASGKLQLLDMMLLKVKSEGQRVVILTQMHLRSGKTTQMEILDDYMRQQFGIDSYERVDGGLAMNKKQAAVQRFNRKGSQCFVFLLDKRACGPAIKLPNIKIVIIFDSDWNPQSDIQSLQRVGFNYDEGITLYRFYTPHSVEERALISARRSSELDIYYKNYTVAVCQRLLKWGAQENFKLFDQLSGKKNNAHAFDRVAYNEESLKLLLGQTAIHESGAYDIKEAYWKTALELREAGNYSKGVPLYAETDKEWIEEQVRPSEFWSEILKDRLLEPQDGQGRGLRARKKVQYCENILHESPDNEEDLVINRKSMHDVPVHAPASTGAKIGKHLPVRSSECMERNAQIVINAAADNLQQDSVDEARKCRPLKEKNEGVGAGCFSNGNGGAQEGCRDVRSEQQQLYMIMKPDLSTLCQALQLQEDVVNRAVQLLWFVNRFKLPKDSKSLLHAVELSLCWLAAEQQHYSIDHSATLALAESLFGVQLVKVESVYARLKEWCSKNFLPAQQLSSQLHQLSQHIARQDHESHEGGATSLSHNCDAQEDQTLMLQQERQTSGQTSNPTKQQLSSPAAGHMEEQVTKEIMQKEVYSADAQVQHQVQDMQGSCSLHPGIQAKTLLNKPISPRASDANSVPLGSTAVAPLVDQLQDTAIVCTSVFHPESYVMHEHRNAESNNQYTFSSVTVQRSHVDTTGLTSTSQGQVPQVLERFATSSVNAERSQDYTIAGSSHTLLAGPSRRPDNLSQGELAQLTGSVQQQGLLPELLPQLHLPQIQQRTPAQSSATALEPEWSQHVLGNLNSLTTPNQQVEVPQQRQTSQNEHLVRRNLPTSLSLHSSSGQLQHDNLQTAICSVTRIPTVTAPDGYYTHYAPLLPAAARGNSYSVACSGVSSAAAVLQNTAPSRLTQHYHQDPLSQEWMRLRKEQGKLKNAHEIEKDRLKDLYMKEQEALKKKFDNLLHEEDHTYSQKLASLEVNMKKVEMNRRLAEAFRMKTGHNNFSSTKSGFSMGMTTGSVHDARPVTIISQNQTCQQQILPLSTRAPMAAAICTTLPTNPDLNRSSSQPALVTAAGISDGMVFGWGGSSAVFPSSSVVGATVSNVSATMVQLPSVMRALQEQAQYTGLQYQNVQPGANTMVASCQSIVSLQASDLNVRFRDGCDSLFGRSASQAFTQTTEAPVMRSSCISTLVPNLSMLCPVSNRQHQAIHASMPVVLNPSFLLDNMYDQNQDQIGPARSSIYSAASCSTVVPCSASCVPLVSTSMDILASRSVPADLFQGCYLAIPEILPFSGISEAGASASFEIDNVNNFPSRTFRTELPRETHLDAHETLNRGAAPLCHAGYGNHIEAVVTGAFLVQDEQVRSFPHGEYLSEGNIESAARNIGGVIYLSDDE